MHSACPLSSFSGDLKGSYQAAFGVPHSYTPPATAQPPPPPKPTKLSTTLFRGTVFKEAEPLFRPRTFVPAQQQPPLHLPKHERLQQKLQQSLPAAGGRRQSLPNTLFRYPHQEQPMRRLRRTLADMNVVRFNPHLPLRDYEIDLEKPVSQDSRMRRREAILARLGAKGGVGDEKPMGVRRRREERTYIPSPRPASPRPTRNHQPVSPQPARSRQSNLPRHRQSLTSTPPVPPSGKLHAFLAANKKLSGPPPPPPGVVARPAYRNLPPIPSPRPPQNKRVRYSQLPPPPSVTKSKPAIPVKQPPSPNAKQPVRPPNNARKIRYKPPSQTPPASTLVRKPGSKKRGPSARDLGPPVTPEMKKGMKRNKGVKPKLNQQMINAAVAKLKEEKLRNEALRKQAQAQAMRNK